MNLKYLAFYRKKYYNGIKLKEKDLWLVALTAKNFVELYEILGKILNNKERDSFIKDVIRMSDDNFILHEWEKEKLDQIEKNAEREEALQEGTEIGIKQGTEQATLTMIKEMLKNRISLDVIAKVTKKPVQEIKQIESLLN